MVINRYVKASPTRTSSETWAAIKTMLVGSDLNAKIEFEKVTGVISAHIGEEKLKNHPLILTGGGPRVRIFCHYGDDAIEIDSNESLIKDYDFKTDWKILVPVESGDEWVRDELANRSHRFQVYEADDGYMGEHVAKSEEMEIDLEGLAKL
jgi:hypothetical protein